MEGDFQGLEVETPIGGISVGRGYSRTAGEDYFSGVAVELLAARFRFGFRTWNEQAPTTEEQEQRRKNARRRDKESVIRHGATFAIALSIITVFDAVLGRGDFFVGWVAGIWGAVLVVHFLTVILDWLIRKFLGDT